MGLRLIEPRGAGSPLEDKQLISASFTRFYIAKMITDISSVSICWVEVNLHFDTYDFQVRLLLVSLFEVEAFLIPVFCKGK